MKTIATLLASAREIGSANNLTLEGDVLPWLAEYLDQRRVETARFPDEIGTPHWDMIAADYDSDRDALFVVAYFDGDCVTFVAGRGSIHHVREFGLNEFPADPARVLDEISRCFWIAGKTVVALDELRHAFEGA